MKPQVRIKNMPETHRQMICMQELVPKARIQLLIPPLMICKIVGDHRAPSDRLVIELIDNVKGKLLGLYGGVKLA